MKSFADSRIIEKAAPIKSSIVSWRDDFSSAAQGIPEWIHVESWSLRPVLYGT